MVQGLRSLFHSNSFSSGRSASTGFTDKELTMVRCQWMALAKHRKELWVEELEDMKDDMHAHIQEQKAHTDEDLNTLFLFRRKYPT